MIERALADQVFRLYLRLELKVVVPVGAGGEVSPALLASALKNLERLGYTCSPALVARLTTLTERDFVVMYGRLATSLRRMRGAHVTWQPMYPNFPRQVMEASDAELYLNALLHYFGDWVGARILPVYAVEDRPRLVEPTELEVIDLGDGSELLVRARALIGSATSLSRENEEDLATLLEHAATEGIPLADVLPPAIVHKEILAFTAAQLMRHAVASDALLSRYFRTATDVLRLLVAMSKGDVSLAVPTKFARVGRPDRRLLLSLIERLPSPDEDLWRHREPWLRASERLHPGEHAKAYPKAAAAFARLRAGERPTTFASSVERAVRAGDVAAALALLAKRPGELARRLDQLLRTDPRDVAATFERVADHVSTPVLLQVLGHFDHRLEPRRVRPIFPKGRASRLVAPPNRLPRLEVGPVSAIVRVCEAALRARWAKLPPLGACFVDPRLRGYLVPFSQRSASKALRTLVRGSRLPLPPGDTLRFFLWWREGVVDGKPTGRVDIDLTAAAFDERFAFHSHISWQSLRASDSGRPLSAAARTYRGVHSGDITSAPNGACEFIDLDLASALAAGVRYVVSSIYSFTRQSYCDLPECFMGWMMRREPGSGEIFEPATVLDRVDLSAAQRVAVPAIFDLAAREMIWVDVGYTDVPDTSALTVTGTHATLAALVEGMLALRRTSLARLFRLHAEARGRLVESAAEADTVFSPDAGVTPFDVSTIVASYLA